jgi:anti-anti-sigma factor
VSESVFTFQTRGEVGVAHVALTEIAHPGQLDRMSREFRAYVAQSGLAAYVLDLSALCYLTSAAIGMLLNTHAHLQAEGKRFAVAAQKDMVVETLGHPHLEKIFTVCTSVDDAVAAVS